MADTATSEQPPADPDVPPRSAGGRGQDAGVRRGGSGTRAVGPKLAHVPALDGLRGLALVAVLLFHDGRLRGGYLGVDLFFVLSGYLITSLLLVEWRATGSVDLLAFWGRRARRLLPALFIVLVAVALYAQLVALPIDRGTIRADGLATLTYWANWHDVLGGASYWHRTLAPSPLLHTWSLAVEEQLYLLWPLIVLALARWGRGTPARVVRRWALGLALASAALFVGLHALGASDTRVYEGTDTRAAAVFLGAFVAGWRRRPRSQRRPTDALRLEVAGIVAAVALAGAWARLGGSDRWLYLGGLPLCSVLGAVVVAAAADGRSPVIGRVASWAPLRLLGMISYGAYLWHWPAYLVLTAHRTGLSGLALSAVRYAVTIALAAVSFVLIERPVRRSASILRGRAGLVAVAVSSVAVAALVVAGAVGAESPTLAGASGVHEPASAILGAPRVVFVGDSVAGSVALPMIEDPRGFGVNVSYAAVNGCQAVYGGEQAKGDEGNLESGAPCTPEFRALVARQRPDAVVVMFGGWVNAQILVHGQWIHACDATYDALLRTRLHAMVVELGAGGARVIVSNGARSTNTFRPGYTDARTACSNRVVRQVVAETHGVGFVDVDAWLCPGDRCRETIEGLLVRSDGVHFRGPGGAKASEWILGQVLQAIGRRPVAPRGRAAGFAPALTEVCRRFADITRVSDIKQPDNIGTIAGRRALVADLRTFTPEQIAALPPDVRVHFQPLLANRSQLIAVIDQVAAGRALDPRTFPPALADAFGQAFDALRGVC